VATLPLPDDVARFVDPSTELLVAQARQLRSYWFGVPDREYAYPTARLDLEVAPHPGGADVLVYAHTLVRDLLLQPDRLHPAASVDSGLITLLPGEQATLRVRAPEPLDPVRLTTAPVLQAVNLF
jgi:beta-mannosidase